MTTAHLSHYEQLAAAARCYAGKYEGIEFIQLRLRRIDELLDSMLEIRAEGGRYGQFCEVTQRSLKMQADAGFVLLAEINDQLADWDNT